MLLFFSFFVLLLFVFFFSFFLVLFSSTNINNFIVNVLLILLFMGSGGIGIGGMLVIGLVFGFLLFSIVGMAVWCMWKRKKKVLGFDGGYVMLSFLGFF